ncbi:hypothetical protein FO519_005852 [Halicephalobus sp. NKZ332]|nr:hypothetical protein FO519_005852 [Halicephalobus sp. NKZ332]
MENTVRFSTNYPYDVEDQSFTNLSSLEEELCNERTSKRNQDLVLIALRSRNAVSRRDDDTDDWGANDLDAKLEWQLIISDPDLKSTLQSRLCTFRQNRAFCDVAIFVRENEIVAHKVVLAALSPVLLEKFSDGEAKENGEASSPPASLSSKIKNSSLPMYELNFVDYESFVALVNYAYTSKLIISNRKVADLYKTAYELEVHPIANACARYLADHLSIQSCIGIRKHANFNKDSYLVNRIDKFIEENIEKIMNESEEFSSLNKDVGEVMNQKALEYFSQISWVTDRRDLQLESLAEKKHMLYIDGHGSVQDCITLSDQTQVGACEIVKDYKRHDGVKRCGHNKVAIGPETVEHHVDGAIRLSGMNKKGLKYASNESLASVESGPSDVSDEITTRLIVTKEVSTKFYVSLAVLFRKLVRMIIQLTEDDEIIREQIRAASEANGTPVREMSSTAHSDGSVSPIDLGNYDTKQVTDAQHGSLLNRLVSQTKATRIPLPQMKIGRCSVGAVFLEGKIIVCGGYNRGECLKSVEQYDVSKGQWTDLPDLLIEHGRFDASIINGKMYAIAGSSGNSDSNKAECFDPKEGKWKKVKDLRIGRSHNGCASLDGKIYCIGGTTEAQILRECEKYDPESDKWEMVAPLQAPRNQAAVISWRGLVVAVGGSDKWNVLDSVEAYDPKLDSWKYLPRMRAGRRGCAVAVVRDSLYAIGGHDGNCSLTSVEILDHPTGNWRPGPPLNTPRANTSAVVTAGNVIYVVGGFNAGTFLPTMELLENESLGWRNWQQESGLTVKEDSDEESTGSGTKQEVKEPTVSNS